MLTSRMLKMEFWRMSHLWGANVRKLLRGSMQIVSTWAAGAASSSQRLSLYGSINRDGGLRGGCHGEVQVFGQVCGTTSRAQ